ncbi:MAG TPA: DUF3667 domain-containing protein, partial [Steroidobacteraceae bacterium]
GHDVMHAITHADHSIFALIRSLLTCPGHVARDFVEGRRKRHFGPFAFLVIAVGLASAVILLTGVQWFSPFKHGYADDVLQRHVNLVILVQMPLLAAFCAILFRADHRSFADHLVLAAYTSGLRALFLALVETPVLAAIGAGTAQPWLTLVYFGVWSVCFGFAASQFYRGNRWWSAARAVGATLLSQLVTVAALMAFLYITTRLHGP